MGYNRKRLLAALARDGIKLTKADLAILHKTWIWACEMMVKIYFMYKREQDLFREEKRRATLERNRREKAESSSL